MGGRAGRATSRSMCPQMATARVVRRSSSISGLLAMTAAALWPGSPRGTRGREGSSGPLSLPVTTPNVSQRPSRTTSIWPRAKGSLV